MGLSIRYNPALAALLVSSALATDSVACGTVEHWTTRYRDPAATDESRSAALFQLSRNCSGYKAVESNRALVDILTDALGRSIPRASVQAVFDTFHCLPGAMRENDYASLAGMMDTSKCPTKDELANWSVVTVDYANIRSRPDVASARSGVAEGGSVVVVDRTAGEWHAITTWAGDSGFIHRDLVTPFVDYEPRQQ